MRRGGDMWVRREGTRQLRSMKNMASRLSIVAVICIISLFSMIGLTGPNRLQNFDVNELWGTAASGGWRPSSAPRSHWPPPPNESNGYLRVRCNGGLNQQRSAIDQTKMVKQRSVHHPIPDQAYVELLPS